MSDLIQNTQAQAVAKATQKAPTSHRVLNGEHLAFMALVHQTSTILDSNEVNNELLKKINERQNELIQKQEAQKYTEIPEEFKELLDGKKITIPYEWRVASPLNIASLENYRDRMVKGGHFTKAQIEDLDNWIDTKKTMVKYHLSDKKSVAGAMQQLSYEGQQVTADRTYFQALIARATQDQQMKTTNSSQNGEQMASTAQLAKSICQTTQTISEQINR